MRATKAYIASLGTTGVLLAASILMLAVVSAVVAFDRWPGGEVSTRVQTLVLDERPAPIGVTTRSTAPAATPAVRTAIPGVPVARTPVTQLVGDENATGRIPAVSPGTPDATPNVPSRVPVPAPIDETTTPIFETISNPGTTADRVAGGTQSATDQVAGGVSKVSPDLGGAVAGTGQAVANTIRDIPLPDHILPGH